MNSKEPSPCTLRADSPNGGRMFPPTRWSLVHRARGETPEARAALAELCDAYWQPVFRVLRRGGCSDDVARERTQAFFAHVLAGGRLDAADPTRGRFRSYLLGALRHFESDLRERNTRLKRGGGIAPEAANPGELPSPDGILGWDDTRFDREWALNIVERGLRFIAEDYAASGRTRQFEALRPSLAGDELPPHATLAADLGITEGALKVAIHRLRRRFRDAVCAEIAQTLPDGGDLEEELRYLIEVLARVDRGAMGSPNADSPDRDSLNPESLTHRP